MAAHQDTRSIGTPHPCGTSLADGFTVRCVSLVPIDRFPTKADGQPRNTACIGVHPGAAGAARTDSTVLHPLRGGSATRWADPIPR